MLNFLSGHKANYRDGLLHHPFELAVCVMSFLVVWQVNDLLINEKELVRTTNHGFLSLPLGILWLWVFMGFVGTCLIIVGLGMSIFSRRGRAIEATGLWLVAAMWLSAGVSAFAFGPSSFTEYGRYLSMGIACVVRLIALNQLQTALSNLERKSG